ncbi:MAG TPA: HNH endonuclease [Frateuria sp.]|uniref:HNH endonuclease n=1 Tax=Frateuria sp. TaxID=2211372 RepID=UPI002D7FADE2|nr:HNH endonuclease [Frateuria sp.]HET6805991.1 HNH endonuclease [Frateuria sp.]
MANYVFNIGRPATSSWWQENLTRGVITAGFDAETGDRGDQILNALNEGDWIFAYCNGPGFVGAGHVGAAESYLLHPDVPADSLSSHQHERAVDWTHYVWEVSRGIRASKVGAHPPRQTREHLDDAIANHLLALLAQRSDRGKFGPGFQPKYWRVLEAVRALDGAASIKDVTAWLAERYPHEDHGDARDNACLLTVNDANRRHHDRGRKNFRSDKGNAKDALFRVGRYRDVSYTLYSPATHGVWDLREADGRIEAVQVEVSANEAAWAEASSQAASEERRAPITSDHDARVRVLYAIALREGQGEFKAALLAAYDNCCAVTGCAVTEILEAAHIRPFRGDHTNRTDNGLLLRADIHTLFDRGLLWVDEANRVQIDERLSASEYSALRGKPLQLPRNPNDQPHPEHLAYHRVDVAGQST